MGKPGERYLSVTGGLLEGPIEIKEIKRRKFNKMTIKAMKMPMALTECKEALENSEADIMVMKSDNESPDIARAIDKLGKIKNVLNTGKENQGNRAKSEKQLQKS